MSRSTRSRFLGVLFVLALVAALWASPAGAATLTWDANGIGDTQVDGGGAWLDANQWWTGSANTTWTSGDNAIFGLGGTGGAVTLASPTTVGLLTFNSFTGTYTLGTDANAITLNTGLTMNLGAGAVTIVSPVTLGGPQSWTNSSTSLLTVSGDVANGGNLLTVGGSGNTTVSSAIGAGAGGLTKNGTGILTLGGVNTYTGATTVKAGTLALGAAGTIANSTTITVGDAGSSGTVLDLTSKTGGFSILSTQTLKGIGTVNIGAGQTLTVAAGGHWAPGNSIGTNAVTGDLTLSGISDFELGTAGASHVAPGTSDRTDVSGTLTLGGTLNLIDNAGANGQGSAGAGSYLIFTQAGTAGGAFATINNIDGYHAKVYTADSNSVFLDNYQIAAASIPTPVALTNVHVGGAFGTSALTIQNTASAVLSEGLNADKGAVTGDASVSGANIVNLAGGTSSTDISVGLGLASTATSGARTGTVTIDLASNGTNSGYANTALTSQVITVNGGVYNLAAANTITDPTNLILHQNSTGSSLTITNTAPAGAYTEGLDATKGAVTGDATVSGTDIVNLAGGASSTSISVGVNTATLGAKTGTVTIAFASNGTNSGLLPTALTPQLITVNGTVYSGQSTWNGVSGGEWGTLSSGFGLNWGADQGSPGLDPGFTGVDTATFGSTSGPVTVNLDGAAPSLNAVTFNGTGSYTIAQGAGATGLTLAGTTPAITAVGTQVISAPVNLVSGTTVAVTNGLDSLTMSGIVSGGALTKSGAGTLTLSNANNYTGLTTVSAGVLRITNGSALGTTAGGTTQSGTSALEINGAGGAVVVGAEALSINGGGITNLGALRNIAGDNIYGGTVTMAAQSRINSDSGTLTLSNATGVTATNLTLVVGGAGNVTISGAITTGTGGVSKDGWGTLTLSGANTYTGATAINAGLVLMNGVSTGASAVTINKSGALGGTGRIPGAVTAAVGDATNAGGAIRLANGAAGTLTLGSTLTFSGTAAFPNSLYFDLGNAGTNDKIVATGAHVAATAGGTLIHLNQLPSTTGSGPYTLIQGTVGGNNFAGYALATTRSGRNVYSALGASGNNLQVTVGPGTAGDATNNHYWKGNTAIWNTAQWYKDALGTVTATTPGYSSNVRFAAATPGNLTNTLGADYEINSLTVDSSLAAVSISGNMLTIDATTDNSNTLGNGITVNNAAGTTIASRVGLLNDQTWTVGTGATLTVTGVVSDFGAGKSLTKAGDGTLYLWPGGTANAGNQNTFSGGVTLAAGTLRTNSVGSNAFGTGPFTISGNTTISIGGNNVQTLNNSAYNINGNFSAVNSGGNTLNFSTGNVTLGASPTINVGTNLTFNINGMIGDGPSDFGLTKDGAGTMVLANATSTYSGKTAVLNGILYALTIGNVGVASSLGAPTTVANGTIDMYNGASLRMGRPASNANTTDRVINLAGTGPGTVTIYIQDNDTYLTLNSAITATGTGAKTLALSVNGDRPGMTLNAGIPNVADGSALSLNATVAGNDQAAGAGRGINLNGVNTFTGPITLTGGAGRLTIGGSGQLGASGTYANTITLAGGEFYYNSSATQILSGLISGTGKLGVNAGSLTLPNANTYTGLTTVSGGTLILPNSLALQNSPLSSTAGGVNLSGVTAPTFGGLAGSRNLADTISTGYGSVTNITLNPGLGFSNTYSGVIANGAPGMTLVKTGLGTQIFSNANLYTGATTISAGTLQLGTGVTAQNGSVTSSSIVDNAALIFNNADAQSYSGNISGTGTLTKIGAGTLTLSGTNSYGGGTFVNAGALQFNSMDAIAGTGRSVVVNLGGAAQFGTLSDADIAAGMARITTNSVGAVFPTNNAASAFDFNTAGLTAATFGAGPAVTYIGTLTPNANTYRLGGGGGTLTFTPTGGTFDSNQNLVLFGNGNTGTVDFGELGKTFGAVTIGNGTVQNGTITGTSFVVTSGTISAILAGTTAPLTKTGAGTQVLNGAAVNTFTGGLNVNAGTLLVDFANLAGTTPFNNLINSGNTLALGGGTLSIKGKATGITNQTLGNVTVNSGGGQILGDKNAGTLNIILGSLTTTASGGSLLVGAAGTAANAPVITTTTNKDARNIYGGRVVFFNGTANTGYDWATTATANPGPYTLSAYAGYSPLTLTAGTDVLNSRINANATMTGSRTTNSLKFENPATAQTFTVGTNTLTLTSGGLLLTGASVAQAPRIAGGSITAGNGSGSYDLVINQYNLTAQFIQRGITGANLGLVTTISSNIVNNDGNSVTLVKAGPGSLVLSGTNTFTGGIVVNGGTLGFNSLGALNNNAMTFNANSTLYTYGGSSTSGSITLNNGSQVLILNNNSSFTVTGKVTGSGGLSVAQGGQGSITLNLNALNNDFTGPIQYLHTQNNQNASLTMCSLADTASLGEGNITLGAAAGTGTNSHNFTYGATAEAALTLNNRRFELATTQALQSINNASGQLFTINTDLLVTGTGSKTLTLGGGGAGISTFAGSMGQGAATLGITKADAGKWILSGNNTFTGGLTIGAGTLQLGSAGALNSIAGLENAVTFGASSTGTLVLAGNSVTVANLQTNATPGTPIVQNADYFTSATLTVGNSAGASGTFAGTIQNGTGGATLGLTKAGAGTLTLTGANTYTGATLISGGRLQLDGLAAGALTTSSLAVGTGGTLGFTAGAASTLDLTGKPFSLGGGTVALDIGAEGVNDALTVGGFTLTATSAFTFNPIGGITSGATYTLLTSTNDITTNGFNITGQTAGRLTLAPTINAKTVTLTPVLDEASWNKAGGGNWSDAGNWDNYHPTAAGDAALFGSAITGPAIIAVDSPISVGYMRFDNTNAVTIGATGSSKLTLDNGAAPASVVVTSGSHIIAENVLMTSGVSVATASGAKLTVIGNLSGAGGMLLSGAGTFEIGGAGQLGGGTYSGAIAIGTGATFKYNSSADQTLQTGIISGGGSLIKDGAGTLTLTGANTFTGGVTLTSGTLKANTNATALGTGAATLVLNSGTLGLGHNANVSLTFGRNTTVGGDVTISLERIAGAGTTTYTLGTLSIGANTLTVQGGNTTSGTAVVAFGATTLTGAATFNVNKPVGGGNTQLTIAGALDNGGNLLTIGGDGTTDIHATASVISGSGGLTKSGTGYLIIGGNGTNPVHSYSGTTTISGGIMMTYGWNLGSGNLTITGGVLQDYYGNAGTFTRALGSGPGQVQITGGTSGFSGQGAQSAIFNIGGASEELVWGSPYFNPSVLALQSTNVNANGKMSLTNGIDLAGTTRTITVLGGDTTGGGTLAGVIRNSSGTTPAGLIKTGPGQLILSAANTYDGATTISDGTLSLTGSLTGTAISTSGTAVLNESAAGVISGAASITQGSSGTSILAGANTYSGATTIAAGILNVNSTAALGDSSATNTLIFTGGTLQAAAAFSSASTRPVTLTSTGTIDTSTFAVSIAGDMSGGGGLTKTGLGALTLSGANNYAGATTVSAGTLQFAKMASLYDANTANWTAANINVKSAATLALNVDSAGTAGFNITNLNTLLGNISVANTAAEGLQAGAKLGIDTSTASGGTFTQGNVIADSTGANGGAIGLTKLGAGTLVLDKANTYTGPTAVSAGTLQLNGSLATPGGLVTVATGGTLNVDAAVSIARDVTVGGGTVNLAGTMSAGTTLKLTSGAVATAAGAPTVATADFSAGAGTVTATTPLAITSALKLPGVTATFTGTSFTAAGANLADNNVASTLSLSGGTLTFVTPSGSAAPTSGLLRHYTFDGVSTDVSGNNGIGTLVGTAAVVTTGGAKYGSGYLSLPAAATDMLRIGTGASDAPQLGTSYTLTTWYQNSTDASYRTLWRGLDISGTGDHEVIVNTATNNLGIFGNKSGGSFLQAGSATIPGGTTADNTWHFMAIVVDNTAGTQKFYTDSGASLSLLGTLSKTMADNYLGAFGNYLTGGQRFAQKLDEAWVYNVALGATDLANIMNDVQIIGRVNLPNTSIAATATSTLDLGAASGNHTLGNLSITNNLTQLTISGAAGLSLNSVTGDSGTDLLAGGVALSIASGNTASNITAASLTKVTGGTLVLTGASPYTGATTVSAGTLDLGGNTANGSLASTILNLGGGTFAYTRTGNQTQSFTTTNLSGLPAISVAAGNILNLGTVANTGGTIDFAGTGLGTVAALTASNIGGIIPGTTFGNTWAVANGADTPITGLADSSYTLTSVALNDPASYLAANIDVDSSQAPTAAITPSSLRFNTAGAYTLTLTGANVITSGGILVTPTVGANLSTITGGTLAGAASATLAVVQNNTGDGAGLTIGSDIVNNTGATSLSKSGAGLLTLAGANSYTGATIVSAGTLNLSGSLTGGGAITVSGSGVLSESATGAISGAASITHSSAGTSTLAGANTYTGATTVSAGTLSLDGSLTGGGAITVSGSAVLSESATGAISGAASITHSSAGTSILAGANSYTGATIVSAGTLNLSGSLTGGGAITVSGSGVLSESSTGVISGASSFTQGSSGTSILAGDNTYTGPTTITAGTLQLDGNTAAGSTVAVGTAAALTGSGIAKGNATITGAGIIDLASPGRIAGTLGVTGGNWNGLGSVGGKATVTSGAFTVANGATLNVGDTLLDEGVSFEVNGSSTATIAGTLNADPNTRVNVIQQGTMVVTGTVNTSGRWVTVGSGGTGNPTATLILEGSGQWNHTNTTVNAPFVVGEAGACRGELIVRDSAQLNAPFMRVASWGSTTWGVITQDGGTVTLDPTTDEYLSVAEPAIGLGGWGQAEYHLNGGVLNCGLWNGPAIWAFWYGPTMGQGRLYFNGGKLIPNTDDPNSAVAGVLNGQGSYMQNLTQVIVQERGAIIDTDGHKITIAQKLEHDLNAPRIDGGLTKQGLGTLTLNGPGASTYTGPTTVSGGRLQLDGSSAAGTLTTSGLAVGTGATLGFTAGTASTLDLTGKPFSLGGTVALDIGASGVNDALTVGDFTLTGNSALTFNIIGGITNGATYTLLTSANPIDANSFSITGQAGKFALTPTINANTVTLTCVLDEGVWNQTGGGSWGTVGNWDNYKPAVAGDAARFGSAITAPAVITVDSAHSVGYMRFDDANAYTIGAAGSSNLTLDSGGASSALVVVTSGSHVIAENVALASSVSVAPASGATLTVSGSLSGAGGVSVCDAGTLVLSGVNTYTGDTSIAAGTLEIGGSGQLGGGTYDGAIAIGTGATFRYNSDANQILQTGVISGGGSLIKDGAGTLTLSAANTHTGPITVTNGVLNVEHAAFTIAPRTYNINSGAVLNVVLDWSYDNVPVGTTTFNGAGTLRFTGGLWIDWYSGVDRFITMSLASGGLIDVPTGSELDNGGWWAVTWTSNLADLNVNGTFDIWDGKDVFVDALTGSGTVTRGHTKGPGDPPTSTLTVGVDNGSGTFSGNITHVSMPLELVKTGSGTQTLTGANTYQGATIVNAGTLAVSGTGDINSTSGITIDGNTAVFMQNSTVASTRTFTLTRGTLGGTGTINTPITIGPNVTIAPGDRTLVSPEAGALIIANTVNLAGATTGGTTEMRLFSATESDMLELSTAGALTYGGILEVTAVGSLAFAIGNNWDLFDFGSASGTFSNDSEFGTVGGTYLPLLTTDKKWSFAYTTGVLSVALGILPGDTNLDGVVDAVDYIAVKTNFGLTGTGITRLQGDLIDNDVVDWADLQELMNAMGTRSVGGAPATPEPATLGLLAIGALAVLRRRRRA